MTLAIMILEKGYTGVTILNGHVVIFLSNDTSQYGII